MYEAEDPLVAAEQLARLDPRAAAEALLTFACDGAVDDGLRLEAASQLAALDTRAAAEALRAVACDGAVDDGLRLEAASQLPAIDRAPPPKPCTPSPVTKPSTTASASKQPASYPPSTARRRRSPACHRMRQASTMACASKRPSS